MRLAGLLLLQIILLEFVAAVAAKLNQATATAVTSALLAQVLLNIKSPFPPLYTLNICLTVICVQNGCR